MHLAISRLLLSSLVLLISRAEAAETPVKQRAEHVFIISFDQGAPAGIAKSDMPLFKEMAAQGAHTWEAYTIVPSITLPSHTSMLTGVGIQKHQIDWNNYKPEKGKVGVPTIFSLAKEKGISTGMFVAKEKFQHLNLPGSVDVFDFPKDDVTCGSVAREFAANVGTLKPGLCFIHFGDPDVKGHEFGMDSPEKIQAFADTDKALKVIRDSVDKAGLTSTSVFILTADHGGHDIKDKNGITRGTHGDSTPDDVTIPWIAWGKGVKPGFTITAPVVQYDTAATALWLLGVPVPEGFWGRPVTSAFVD
ncbi:alkaline phosphatase family protein [Luteolibacter yonseiensis]|uniref:Alkaline phosphatase family protein n=1 Tax=Luteolibacter yonseiensis TaxID=1144680 RepID=A0A934VA94_9BACT|nr:alkaline phosphatase family protein [Luteolibacter yonseiensis]MBK1814626.1 alkaline phosphatase family protein [Luteolibacter yonseiensis]